MQNAITGRLAVAAVLLVPSACGGSGGGTVSAPPPPPAYDASVEPLSAPASQEFATAGGDTASSALRIRYDAASRRYDVMLPGGAWEALVDDPAHRPGIGAPNTEYVFSSSPRASFFMVRAHPRQPDTAFRYQYSNLAAWGVHDAEGGIISSYTAFGVPTPAGSVPVTGSGAYQGMIEGTSTVDSTDWDGNPTTSTTARGTVALRFDFANGTLSGEISPMVWGEKDEAALGAFAFKDTVFGVGSRSFSGAFASSTSGPNAFSGQFTGPNAEELIGRWTVPFLFEGAPESASGAWIAKRTP